MLVPAVGGYPDGTVAVDQRRLTGCCRSELAREKLTGAAFIQEARVIVDVFRKQELGAPLAPTGYD
ncbi:hypothetical protein METHPM2_1220010 [Pseudomonas sp. PM2]